jgi:protein tyrosine/serine phosphatase
VANFQKVDDRVYRGAQPTDVGFANLAKLGIKTVIDLRFSGEHSQAAEEKRVTAQGMHYVSIPMHGMSTPSNESIFKTLALLTDTNAGPVFVHCKRGADRTGTVVAVYRIQHDRWKNEKALEEARSLGMSWFQKAMQNYILRYRPPQSEATAFSANALGAQGLSPLPAQ